MSTIGQLKDRVTGRVVTADDAAYDEARTVYNAMIDRRPRAVVRCVGTDDVVAAVNFARDNSLDVAIRGGGHSVPGFGTSDGGVVIDLSGMRVVTVDAATRTARAQGGATWGDFNDATYTAGLATTGGIISTTGVGGLTLGGGIGYLARSLGLSCDNVISAEVVTADGRVLRRQRHRERGPLLGAAWRRRQLRRRDELRVPAQRGQRRVRRTDLLQPGRDRRPAPRSTASSSPTRPNSSADSRRSRSRRRCRSSRRIATATPSSASSAHGQVGT